MKLKKILNGILALVVISSVLLISDIENRIGKTGKDPVKEGNGTLPEKNIAKKGIYKFCLAHYVDSPNSEDVEKGIRDELKNQGLAEGTDFTLKVFNAQGDISTLNSITETVAADKWDMVFASSTPTIQSFSKKITNSPIVFTNVGDPVRAGLGESFNKHNPNLTGISTMSDFEKLVKLVKETMPGIKKIGTLFSPGEINSVAYKEELEKAAKKHGLTLIAMPANSSTEVTDATTAIINRGIQAFIQISDNLTGSCGASIIKAAYDTKTPYFSYVVKQLSQGAIAIVSSDYYYAGVDAAVYAKEILDGKSPAEIPFRFVSKSMTEVNVEAMKYFNVKVPEKYIGEKSTTPTDLASAVFSPPVKMAVVHYIFSRDCDDVTLGILDRLMELGHTRNGDFILDEYNANGDIGTLNDIVRVVSENEYDIIFPTVLATTLALVSKIKDTPILFTVVADPVNNDLGESYTNHIQNVTGIDGMSYTDKGVDLVKAYLPNVKTLGVLFCPGEMASISSLKELEKSCKKSNVKVVSVPVNSVSDVTDATTMLCMKKIDAICQLPDNCTIPGFSSMVKVTRKQKMPLFCFISSQVEMGAIAAIAGDYIQQGKEIADVAIQVIGGKSPSEIPFSRIKQIKTVINPEAAKAYGLKTPDSLLKSADQIVKEPK